MSAEEPDEPPRLSALAFTTCLLLLLGIFLFLNPFWTSDTIEQWDQNILWSYYPIPLLVAVALRLEHKLGWGSLLLESMKLTFVKFSLTFVGANLAWSWFGVPGQGPSAPPPAAAPAADEYALRPGPEPKPLPAPHPASLHGQLLDREGEPCSGALIWLELDRGEAVAARPEAPLELSHRGDRVAPDLLAVQTWRPIHLISSGQDLHTATVALAGDGSRLFNVPLLAGATREFLFPRPVGEVLLGCSVHGDSEPGARLVVLDHGDFTRTDAEGRYSLPGLPAGRGTLRALTASGERASLAVELAEAEVRGLELKLP